MMSNRRAGNCQFEEAAKPHIDQVAHLFTAIRSSAWEANRSVSLCFICSGRCVWLGLKFTRIYRRLLNEGGNGESSLSCFFTLLILAFSRSHSGISSCHMLGWGEVRWGQQFSPRNMPFDLQHVAYIIYLLFLISWKWPCESFPIRWD